MDTQGIKMKHEMLLTAEPFELIKSGQKTIELRLNDLKRQAIQVGDEITFYRTDDQSHTILTQVLALHYFDSFEELYHQLPLEKCGYTVDNIVEASPKDMENYYSKEQQKRYGVVGIELRLI